MRIAHLMPENEAFAEIGDYSTAGAPFTPAVFLAKMRTFRPSDLSRANSPLALMC